MEIAGFAIDPAASRGKYCEVPRSGAGFCSGFLVARRLQHWSGMDKEELQARCLTFAVGVRWFCEELRRNPVNWNAVDQLLDCSSSVGANYRSACRGRSRAEFIAKLGVAVEEIDESVYWLELLKKSGAAAPDAFDAHLDEARQLRAILAKSYGTARANQKRNTAKRTGRQNR